MSELVTSAVRRVGQALAGLLSLARVRQSTAAAAAHPTVQSDGLQADTTEVWQPYGFQARPKAGSVAVQAAMGGHAESLVTIMVHDRRYTIALAEGEVALVDDLGAKVHLTRNGIVIDASAVKLGAANPTAGVARVGDTATLAPALVTWLGTVGTATGAGAPPATTASITTGSSKVRCG